MRREWQRLKKQSDFYFSSLSPLRGHGVAQHRRNERKNCNLISSYPLTPYLQVLAREINCNVSGGIFLIYSFTKWFLFKII
ncbi:hypothetical protein B7P43_G07258 [Cryptotermes secundus]|uniref:Uncharacterized protein n=1 Tax=Cryptotermes secundus TaxID=105785 RepID=A0A2J7RC47_9NEOP|nr:hypothetical protein B7P43_G07258 [Cryptotermes secundus]